MLFIESDLETITREGVGTYTAGKLNSLGLVRRQLSISKVNAYLSEQFPDSENKQVKDLSDEYRLAFWLLDTFGIAVITADYNRGVTPATLIEWAQSDLDFVRECYDLAVKLNPSLDPDYRPDQPQAETKDESGLPLDEDEVKKKASTTRKRH